MFYVTYKEGEKVKKAIVDKQRYNLLTKNSFITDLVIHPSEIAMNEVNSPREEKKQIILG